MRSLLTRAPKKRCTSLYVTPPWVWRFPIHPSPSLYPWPLLL